VNGGRGFILEALKHLMQVQSDLLKDSGHLYFIKHLESTDSSITPESREQAAFVLSAICNQYPKAQHLCAQAGLLQVLCSQMPHNLVLLTTAGATGSPSAHGISQLVKWLIICIGKLCGDVPELVTLAVRHKVSLRLKF
jgi:regulatory associated protein of mTOR